MKHLGVLLALLLGVGPSATQAGFYWNQGVHSTPISVCFVGNALSSRPARVQEILDYITRFEHASSVRFNYLGTCPAPTVLGNGNHWYGGSIRVVIPSINVSGTGMVPGVGCPMFGGAGAYDGGNDDWGSWSNAPDDLGPHRSCLYNLKLGDDPWNATPYLNHTLHEFGHALGLSHEHERADATCPGPGGGSTGYLTPYDIDSVMHYTFGTCTAPGNYAHTGLSYFDKLSLRMLYPEAGHGAQIIGRKRVRVGEPVTLQFGWRAEGAHTPFVVSSIRWDINGTFFSNGLDFQQTFNTPGARTISLTVVDFLGRTHTGAAELSVMSAAEYADLMAALGGINMLLISQPPDAIFVDGFE